MICVSFTALTLTDSMTGRISEHCHLFPKVLFCSTTEPIWKRYVAQFTWKVAIVIEEDLLALLLIWFALRLPCL